MKLLLTGATGFVGGALQQRIVADDCYDLTVAVRRVADLPGAVQIGNIDAQTDWTVALQGVDVVIHSAARAHILVESSANPLIEFRKINVDGTVALAQQALAAGVKRFVFISSIGVNGVSTGAQPFTESNTPAPHTAYAISKLEAEVALQELCAGSTMQLVVIRPPLVYAAHAPGNFARLLKFVSLGLPLPFALVKNQRSMIALENMVDFVLCCVKHPQAANQVFLIADQQPISTPQMLRYLAHGMGKRAWSLPVPVSLLWMMARIFGREALFNQLCGSLVIDTSKAQHLLGWTPPVATEQAIYKAAQAYMAK